LSPIGTAAIIFVLIVAGAMAGIGLRRLLPESHLSGDSKDVIKLATALIGTMSALVLALLFASTRQSYERTSISVGRMTTDLVQLDQAFEEYGPEAAPLRAALRSSIDPLIDSIWKENAERRHVSTSRPPIPRVLSMIRGLAPKTPEQASLQTRALQLGNDLAETQLGLATQAPDSISHPFINVLVLWLVFIFAVFSMSSPTNATLVTVLFLCILSASGAIYLIIELGSPFDGLMQISSDGVRSVLQ
jgi:hypothetical protein